MRIRLLVEGAPADDGRLIEVGALTLPDGPIPLMDRTRDDYGMTSIGVLYGLRREPDGSITCETDRELDRVHVITCGIDDTKVTEGLPLMTVTSARVRYGMLSDDGEWPWPDYPQRGKTPNVCPECEQGKHGNCDGSAWDDETDDFTACTCECHLDEPPC